MSNRFPHLIGNDGKRFYFGQDLAEAEESFRIPAKQHPPDVAWAVPNQRIIETKEVILTFDAGKLMRIEFLADFDFKIPLAPYAEDWKNLNDLGFASDTTIEEAAGYLSAWEKRVSRLGAKKIEGGEDLLSGEFSIYCLDEDDEDLKVLGIDWNHLGINMGVSRRTGKGGLWTDGWIMEFTTARNAELHQRPIRKFRSMSAFCDEFNTAARR